MKWPNVLPLLAMLVLAAAGSVSATTDVESIEISGAVPNPCTGEDVYFTGTVHIVRVANESETGMSLTVTNVSYADVLGIGVDTQNLYKYVAQSTQMVSQDSDLAPLTSTVQQKVRWVTAGGQNDLDIEIFQHLTWDANGNAVAYRFDLGEQTCS